MGPSQSFQPLSWIPRWRRFSALPAGIFKNTPLFSILPKNDCSQECYFFGRNFFPSTDTGRFGGGRVQDVDPPLDDARGCIQFAQLAINTIVLNNRCSVLIFSDPISSTFLCFPMFLVISLLLLMFSLLVFLKKKNCIHC